MPGFAGLTHELCRVAFELIDPSVTTAMTKGVFKRPQGSMIVLDPTMPWEPKYKAATDDNFEELVLLEVNWGDPDEFEYPFGGIAASKAFASWKTGKPSIELQQEYPHLYEEGWTKFGGSVVRGGLVVAVSGAQWWFDQMVAGWMVDAIQGVCLDGMHNPVNGAMSNPDITFLTG